MNQYDSVTYQYIEYMKNGQIADYYWVIRDNNVCKIHNLLERWRNKHGRIQGNGEDRKCLL